MRTAILFAIYFANDYGLKVARSFLDRFKAFEDADIYVGINPAEKMREWISDLRAPNIRYAQTPDHLVIDSDASAYQTAFRLMHESGRRYDLLWFGHTKSASTGRWNWAEYFGEKFFGRRIAVEHEFEDPDVGTYGPQAVIHPEPILDCITPYLKLPYPMLPIMYVHTFYACRGQPVHYFLKHCERFLTDPLPAGGRMRPDGEPIEATPRYFFERDFYQLVWKQGYVPTAGEVVQLDFNGWDRVVSNREAFDRVRRFGAEGGTCTRTG